MSVSLSVTHTFLTHSSLPLQPVFNVGIYFSKHVKYTIFKQHELPQKHLKVNCLVQCITPGVPAKML